MSTSGHPGITLFLSEVHQGEVELEREFHAVGQRHPADHEVRHVTVDLARWSWENQQALAELTTRYSHDLADDLDPHTADGPARALRTRTSELLGRRPEPGVLLLHDLRHLYLLASGNSVHWTALSQAAKSLRDPGLLNVMTSCHSRTTRQATWCNATIKAVSAQILTSM